MYYYDVSVGLEGTWKNTIFTYCYEQELKTGYIVLVPFGKRRLIGRVVTESLEHPINVKEVISIISTADNSISNELANWIKDFYPMRSGSAVQLMFLPQYLSSLQKNIASVDRSLPQYPGGTIDLSLPQKQALEGIKNVPTSILHGLTGSGKTRIYAKLAQECLSAGKSVLILQPEIGLTSSVLSELTKYVSSDSLLLTHSGLSPKKRSEAWHKINNNDQPYLIVGPRSSLFLPYKKLGLIVVDEFHDQSYKQDGGIRYDSIFIASKLAQIHQSRLVFGSATPSISHTFMMLQKKIPMICLHDRPGEKNSKKDFAFIDSKDRTAFTKDDLLSDYLIESLKETLSNKKQSLVFLNRRGSARITLCGHCGSKVECTKCESPLVYHHDSYQNICHVCGNKEKPRTRCRACGKSELISKSYGTKYIEEVLNKALPGARIKRFDTDNKKSESLQENYQDIKQGSVDVIIGTQMISKGIDLPLLQTVCIVQAETSLYIPDFSSEERTFQQISQVIGRVGRVHSDGKIVLQTYQPKNEVLKMSVDEDWHNFYIKELDKRRSIGIPPFCYAMIVSVTKNSRESVQKALNDIALDTKSFNVRVLGPAPDIHEKKQKNKFTWQIIVLSKKRSVLTDISKTLPDSVIVNFDPASFL